MPQLQSQPGWGTLQSSPSSFKHHLAPGMKSRVSLYLKTGAQGEEETFSLEGKGCFSLSHFILQFLPDRGCLVWQQREDVSRGSKTGALLSLLLRLSLQTHHRVRGEGGHRRKSEVKTTKYQHNITESCRECGAAEEAEGMRIPVHLSQDGVRPLRSL